MSGNAGTPGGNVTYAAGRFGQAFRFNGNDYVSVGDKEEFDFRRSDPFTLSVWVCRTDNDRSCIVNKYSNFYLYYNVAWRFQLGAEGAYRNLVASGASPQNVWFHLAVTYDAATQLLTMYIDGRAVDTADCAGIGEFSTTHPLQLGGGSWEGCRGLIDEFMLFNRALSQAEIGALYDAQANGLVGTFCDLMELVPYEYAVHAVNRAGEASSVSRTVTMDVPDSAPMGTVTSPRSPQRDRSSSQVFTGTAHDTNGDTTLALATLWWDVGQSPGTLISSGLADVLSGDSDTWSIAASGLRDATITWNIKLRDSAGHEGWIGPDNTLVIGPDTFYVAPAASGGDDANPGTLAEPFATIQRFADTCYPGDTCYIRAGTYRETVRPVRGGHADAPIIFAAYNGEHATVSGADPVSSGWQTHGGHIHKTTAMNWDLGKGNNQVFVAGEAMLEARWPNCTDIMVPALATIDAESNVNTGPDPDVLTLFDSDLTQPDSYWVGAIVHGVWGARYHAGTAQVTASARGVLTAAMDCVSQGSPATYGRYYLVGVLGELDSPGEWFYDDGTSTLYLWAPDGATPAAVEAKARSAGFVLDGRSYIDIDGVDLFACNATTDFNSHHITLRNMEISYPSHYTILSGRMDTGHHGTANTGVILAGYSNTLQDSTIRFSAGNGVSLIGNDCVVTRCSIGNVNYAVTECAAVNTGHSKTENNQVTHCRLYNSARGLIVHDEAWNMKIAHNDMFNTATGREVWDLGATYCTSTDGKGSEIAYNRIHNFHSIGIYLDYSCRNFEIHHNLIYDCTERDWYGILMREHSRGISISHNTVYGSISANPLDSHTDAPTSMEGTVIKNNLARWINTVHGDWPAEVVIGNNYTSTQWSSLIVDLEQDDYRVKAGSPLIDAGQTSGFTADFEGNPILGVPDIGAYEYSSGTITYTLTTSAAHGTIASTPNRTHYSPGETVTLQATPDSGYVFNGWADGLTGTANPATLVMNSNKSVTANFGPVAPTTYTLTVTAANGSVTRTPSKSSYTAGETVSLLAVPSSGYAFTGWSGAISGTSNPAAVVMDGSKSVTANFAVRTYTLDVSASSGSVTKNPNQATYPHGETVTLAAMAALGYEFTGWTGDLVGTSNPATVIMDGNKSITAQFSLVRADDDPPVLHDSSPAPDSIQVPLNSLVVLRISDEGEGVDGATVSIRINGDTVYAGNAASYSSAGGICRRMGDPAHYVYAYQPAHPFDFHDVVVATVNASDLAGNAMSEQSYSFETEMWAFGDNRRISTGPEGLDKGAPAAARDNGGNTWVAWHAGAAGTRDIYLARLASGAEHFGPPVRLTESASDQCNPDLAVGTDGTFYVVWQDNGRGNWDIHARTSRDGIVWSSPVQVTDSDQDEVHPAIAIDARSPNCAHVAWQDNRAGNDDIYVTSSSDGFVSKTIACVTSNVQDQVRPRIAIDASHTVHLVWTDYRNGSAGIVGAASNRGPWTNVPIAIGSGSQSDPVIAAEPTGSTLHFAWVNNTGGDDDIYYGCSSGLPASPLIGSTVVDDSSGADQRAPAIVAAGGPGGNARVFICWQDFRNAADHPDTDLYAIEVNAGAETNLYVGDGGTRARQSEPLVGVDLYGHPYVVWTDDRNGSDDIYFAASTFVEPTPLDTKMIARAAGGTVGAALPSGLDDVSVQIPAGACPYDVNVSIARIRNPRPGPAAEVRPYEFGPSGLRFDTPVTIRIPYTVVPDSRLPQPYWYDSMTGTWTQQSITNVEHIALSSTIHALQFQTTHFTPYALVAVADIGEAPAAGGSGGGGCSLVRHNGPGGAPEFFLPFVLLAAVMLALRRKDAKRRSDS